MKTIQSVEQLVQSQLTFSPDARIDEMDFTRRANCIGYVLLGSYALEQAGIDHSIMYVNGHATTLIPTDNGIHMSDVTSPHLSTNINNDLFIYPGELNRKVGRLNTVGIIADSPLDWHNSLESHPWLKGRTSENYDALVAIYSADEGRDAIYFHQKFEETYSANEFVAAAENLISMNDIFPDIDIRSPFYSRVKKTVHKLAAEQEFDLAEEVTSTIFENCTFSKDSRFTEYQADCYRYIAQHSHASRIARKALQLYQKAAVHPLSIKPPIQHKINKCKTLNV